MTISTIFCNCLYSFFLRATTEPGGAEIALTTSAYVLGLLHFLYLPLSHSLCNSTKSLLASKNLIACLTSSNLNHHTHKRCATILAAAPQPAIDPQTSTNIQPRCDHSHLQHRKANHDRRTSRNRPPRQHRTNFCRASLACSREPR